MKNLTLIIFIAFTVCCGCLTAQEIDTVERYVNLNVAPLSVFNRTPRIRAGVEFWGTSDFVFGLDVGYGFSRMVNKSSGDYNDWADDYNSISLRPEIKYIISRSDYFVQFIAIEGFYISSTDTFYDSYYTPLNDNSDVVFNKADFELRKTGVHLKYGFVKYLSDNITVECYGGVGIARRIKAYSNVEADYSRHPDSDGNSIWGSFKDETNRKVPHLTLGVKFGFDLYP